MTKERVCTKCGLSKPETPEYFYYISANYRTDKTWLARQCKECAKIRASSTFRQRRFGLSNAQFVQMIAKQHNLCAICGQPEEVTLCVDHRHSDGKVRDLLCRLCNMMLGSAHDNPEVLRKGAEYLEKHAGE